MFEQDDEWREDAPFEKNSADLTRQMLSGANWFFWIAILSLIDTLVSPYYGTWTYAFSMGMSLGVDSVAQSAVAHGMGSWMKIAAFALNIVIAGIFILFGFAARRGNMAAFVTGLILYVLDGVLFFFTGTIGDRFLFGSAILGVVIHAVGVYYIFSGILAARKLTEYQKT